MGTIVNFPVRNLELREFVDLGPDAEKIEAGQSQTKYDLVANICHEGKPADGFYKAHLLNKANKEWYEVHDLHVREILPQLVALSESYMQVFELQLPGKIGGGDGRHGQKAEVDADVKMED